MKDQLSRLVYSTELGDCRKVLDESCRENEVVIGDGNVRVQRESKGRGGKTVTTIKGLPLNESDLKALLKTLKKKSGAGGAVKQGVIEIQGDKRELLMSELKKAGYDAKLSGG